MQLGDNARIYLNGF